MLTNPYIFSIVILSEARPGGPWQEWFRDELSRREVEFDDGRLRIRGELVGFGRCEEVAMADVVLRNWIATTQCPVLGEAIGVFDWTHSPADNGQAAELVTALAHLARGAVLRAGDLAPRESVVSREFAIREANSEYGFDCGAALLERTPGPYVDSVIAALRAQLESAGIDAWLGFDDEAGAGENPIRMFPPLRRHGVQVPDAGIDEALGARCIEIWAFRQNLYHSADEYWAA